jgi:hypothetical protein
VTGQMGVNAGFHIGLITTTMIMENNPMKTLISKATSAALAAIAIVVAFALAGLGLAALFYLALFALAVVGLSLLAAPLVAMAQKNAAQDMGDMPSENSSAQ